MAAMAVTSLTISPSSFLSAERTTGYNVFLAGISIPRRSFPRSLGFGLQRRLNGFSVLVASLPPPSTSNLDPRKLYVSGLSFKTTVESLTNAFEKFGRLVDVNLVMDRVANRPRGFAFLQYATEEESLKAIEGMHGKFLDGRVIFVEVSRPKSEIPARKQYPGAGTRAS
ncbi:organelle RRM domain-containing protein 6, chloroplastic-like [Wolffia australiana]